ncbi:nitroreductase family protein [Fusibacter paucivorans]|uniref:Nitroreductase family protein n=1 Tax=Fusibacter paucivorans TaxID=76009 RepID=A0ABS5PMT0_9FIRM|nr:nitroreductase family protein [Fusibacter paucivorans]MBS7526460.1 nitroreductase family protein [Fusibacter paucivorans]
MDRIRQRTSVRAYELSPFNVETLKPLLRQCRRGVFGNILEPEIVDTETARDIGITRFSSFGAITGSPAYLFARVPNERSILIDYGYSLEHMVLNLTAEGLGTCWIGNIPNKGRIERHLGLEDDDNIPALISVGYRADEASWHQKIRAKHGRERKRIDQLFFANFIGSPLKGYHINRYEPIFEAVQRAPSTMNRQPWRIVIDDTVFRFYMQSDYLTEQGLNLKYIDMGIVMCHFGIAVEAMGFKGQWINEVIKPFEKYEYITSFVIEGFSNKLS